MFKPETLPITKKSEFSKIEAQEPSAELLKVQEELRFLKDKESYKKDPEKYKSASKQTYKDIAGFLWDKGGEFVTDVNKIYREYGANGRTLLIVRREDPEKVLSLSEGGDVSLTFDPQVVGDRGDKYVNCAIWPYGRNAVSGIKNAFLEGRGMAGPLVTVVGVRQNPANNQVEMAKDAMTEVGDIERDAVRIVSGTLKKEDLAFIIVRIQKDYFPTENLVEAEKNDQVKQIFRGFTF
jgi:hypothetical protein